MPYTVSNTFEIFGDPVPETVETEELALQLARELAEIMADWYIQDHQPISEEESSRYGLSNEVDFAKRWETVEAIDREALIEDILENVVSIEVEDDD